MTTLAKALDALLELRAMARRSLDEIEYNGTSWLSASKVYRIVNAALAPTEPSAAPVAPEIPASMRQKVDFYIGPEDDDLTAAGGTDGEALPEATFPQQTPGTPIESTDADAPLMYTRSDTYFPPGWPARAAGAGAAPDAWAPTHVALTVAEHETLLAALAAVRAELDRANLVIEGLVEDKESALRRMIARRNERDEANAVIAAVRALCDAEEQRVADVRAKMIARDARSAELEVAVVLEVSAVRSALGSSTGRETADE